MHPMPRRTVRGFTLLEMLVVFALLGVTLVLVAPALKRGFGNDAQRIGRELQVSLRQARAESVLARRSVAVWVDLDQRSITVEGGREVSMPAVLSVDTVVAEHDGNRAAVRFYPDGSSSGGSVELRGSDGGTVVIEVDWLTGRVSQRDDAV